MGCALLFFLFSTSFLFGFGTMSVVLQDSEGCGVLSWGLFGDLLTVATWWGVCSTSYFVVVVAEFRVTIYC